MSILTVWIKPGFDAEIKLTRVEMILFRYETGLITKVEADEQLMKLGWPTYLGYETLTHNRIKELVSHLL